MIQKILLPVINNIFRYTQIINNKFRIFLLYLFVFILIFSIYVYQIDEFFGFITPAIVNALVGTICFVGIIFLGVTSEIKYTNIHKFELYLLMICGLIVFISGFHHYIGYSYMLMGLFMTFLIPFFVLVWNQNINNLFKIVSYINVFIYIIFFIINCIVAPMGNPSYMFFDRYFGIASDPNGMAKISVSAVVCSIYLLFYISKKTKYLLIPVLSMAIAMTLLTISRTNLIALFFVIIFTLIMLIKKIIIQEKNYKKQLLFLLSVCLIVILLIPVAMKCCEFNNTISVNNNSQTEIKTDTNADSIVARTNQGKYIDGSINYNTVSSGRLTIWKYCIDRLSIIGESPQKGIIVDLGNEHVHNTVLEITYRSGVFAGGCFFLFEVICCIWVIKILISRRKLRSQDLFTVLSVTAFGIASLFDIVVLPFAKITVLLLYISLPVMICEDNNLYKK